MESFAENSIYGLLSMTETKIKKPHWFRSRFKSKIEEQFADGLYRNKTMGPAKVAQPNPANYLRKHTIREKSYPGLKPETKSHSPDENKSKVPPVPKRHEVPLLGLKTTRDFVCVNTCNAVSSLPKIPEKRIVETHRGDTFKLVPSGLEPVYVHKKDFGEVPSYVRRRKEEVERAKEEYEQFVADCFKEGTLRQLTEDDHKTVVEGLKTNWQDVQDRYANLPVIIDTLGKKHRKERMEAQIMLLERDIDMLEKYKIIYIAN